MLLLGKICGIDVGNPADIEPHALEDGAEQVGLGELRHFQGREKPLNDFSRLLEQIDQLDLERRLTLFSLEGRSRNALGDVAEDVYCEPAPQVGTAIEIVEERLLLAQQGAQRDALFERQMRGHRRELRGHQRVLGYQFECGSMDDPPNRSPLAVLRILDCPVGNHRGPIFRPAPRQERSGKLLRYDLPQRHCFIAIVVFRGSIGAEARAVRDDQRGQSITKAQ